MSDLITAGRVGAPYGIRGELRLQLFLEDPALIDAIDDWYLKLPQEKEFKPFVNFKIRKSAGEFFILFKDVRDRDEARRFTHALLAIPRAHLPTLGQNEFYWSELEGLTVYTMTGKCLGVIDYLLETGANDVLVIKTDVHTEILVPYVYGKIVISVDLLAKKMIVDWEQ